MATEYHNRVIDGRRLSWRVDRLRALAIGQEVSETRVDAVFEFDEVYWFDTEHRPTCRAVVQHLQRIEAANLDDPILLSPDGYLVDGMHRVAKAFLTGRETVPSTRLPHYPPPDRESLLTGS